MRTPKEQAERLLTHYLRTAFKAAGLNWNEDNDSEVGSIVDAFEAMAVEAVRAHLDNEHGRPVPDWQEPPAPTERAGATP